MKKQKSSANESIPTNRPSDEDLLVCWIEIQIYKKLWSHNSESSEVKNKIKIRSKVIFDKYFSVTESTFFTFSEKFLICIYRAKSKLF